jgi:hypothetical protein
MQLNSHCRPERMGSVRYKSRTKSMKISPYLYVAVGPRAPALIPTQCASHIRVLSVASVIPIMRKRYV